MIEFQEGKVYNVTFPGNLKVKYIFIKKHQHTDGTLDYEFREFNNLMGGTMMVYGNDICQMNFQLIE